MKVSAAMVIAALALGAATAAQLNGIRTVYILPMGSGMDQYVANRLTRSGVLQVVADPQRADAILTDRLGSALESRLDELYPAPKKEKDEEDEEDSKTEKALTAREQAQFRAPSFGRGKGTVFLVDRKTRDVLWSIYERPHSASADELNRTADRIAARLKRDLKGKPPSASHE